MGLVSTWLTGIGLAYAWPTFEAAGIVTPAALASLDVTVFAALGVTDPEDRRKLFYLVQRIKLAVVNDANESAQQDTVASTVDQVLADTLPQQQQPESPPPHQQQPKSQPSSPSRQPASSSQPLSSSNNHNHHNNSNLPNNYTYHHTKNISHKIPPEDDGRERAGLVVEETAVQEARRVLSSKVVLPQQQQHSSRRLVQEPLHSPRRNASSRRSQEGTTTATKQAQRQDQQQQRQPSEHKASPRARSTTNTSTAAQSATTTRTTTTSRMVQPTAGTATTGKSLTSRTSLPQPSVTKSRIAPLKNNYTSRRVVVPDAMATTTSGATTTLSPKQPRQPLIIPQQTDDEENLSNHDGGENDDNMTAEDDHDHNDCMPSPSNTSGTSTAHMGDDKVDAGDCIASRTRSARNRERSNDGANSGTARSGITPPRLRRPEAHLKRPTTTTVAQSSSIVSSSKTAATASSATSSTIAPRGCGAKNHPKSKRTGKSLSVIHSDRILPMSPLMGFVSSKPSTSSSDVSPDDEEEVGDEEDEHDEHDYPENDEQQQDTGPRNRRRASGTAITTPQTSATSQPDRRRSTGLPERRLSASSQNSVSSQTRPSRSRRPSFDSSNDHHSDSDRSERSALSTNSRNSHIGGGGGGCRSLQRPRTDRARNVGSGNSNFQGRRRKTVDVVNQQQRKDTFDPTSFKVKIEDLREDNAEDHEVFLEQQNDDEVPEDDDEDMRIRVVVRKRPMSGKELGRKGSVDVVHPLDYGPYGRMLVYQPKTRVDLTKEIDTLPFAFDNVFDESSTNSQIYERTVRNLIPPLFEGQWGCVFAYGQTGSGKTFTMMGSNMTTNNKNKASSSEIQNLGLYYMAALDIFQALATPGFEHFSVFVSLFEIYGGKLFDLLNDRNQIKCLEDHKGRVRFPGLSEHPLTSADALIDMIEEGACNRSTGSTSRNSDSSRSHAVLQLHIYQPPPGRRPRASCRQVEFSRLTFIDLAGSERGADTYTSSKETRMEGAEINTSLLALKEVIRALATGDSMAHVPFRGSKLTQVLKESFVGESCRSVMIACVSPSIGDCEQTLNTLRYANRVKERNSDTGELSALVVAPPPSRVSTTTSRNMILPTTPTATSATQKEHENFNDEDEDERGEYNGSSSGPGNQAPIFRPSPNRGRTPRRKKELEREGSFTGGNGSRSTEASPSLLRRDPSDIESAASCNSQTMDELLGEPEPSSQAAQDAILTHKEAMTTLLEMVNDEMALVNGTTNGNLGAEDYVAAVNEIHVKQLDMFSSIRERIQEYRTLRKRDSLLPSSPKPVRGSVAAAATGQPIMANGSGEQTRISEDEGSIEDLRVD